MVAVGSAVAVAVGSTVAVAVVVAVVSAVAVAVAVLVAVAAGGALFAGVFSMMHPAKPTLAANPIHRS